jgi:hypothetical protein
MTAIDVRALLQPRTPLQVRDSRLCHDAIGVREFSGSLLQQGLGSCVRPVSLRWSGWARNGWAGGGGIGEIPRAE